MVDHFRGGPKGSDSIEDIWCQSKKPLSTVSRVLRQSEAQAKIKAECRAGILALIPNIPDDMRNHGLTGGEMGDYPLFICGNMVVYR
jgi:hypothetical protein